MAEILARGDVDDPCSTGIPSPCRRAHVAGPQARDRRGDAARRQGRRRRRSTRSNAHKKELRTLVAHRVNLKYAPDLRFVARRQFRRAGAHRRAVEIARGRARSRRRATKPRGTSRDRRDDGRSAARAPSATARRAPSAAAPLDPRRGQRLDQSRQAGRRHLDPGGRRSSNSCSTPRRRAMPARSIRSPPACCRSRSARRPRPCPVVQDGAKAYRSRSAGARRPTPTTPRASRRALRQRARARPRSQRLLPRFVGVIEQTPPTYSAIKIAGERAYDLARDGADFEIAAREIVVHRLELVERRPRHGGASRPNAARAPMCARSRATSAARSAATAMSSLLRRTRVGPFSAESGVTLEPLAANSGRCARAALLPRRGRPFGTRSASPSTATARRRSGAASSCCCAASAAPDEGPAYARLLRRAGRGRRGRGRLFRLDAGVQPERVAWRSGGRLGSPRDNPDQIGQPPHHSSRRSLAAE